VFRDLRAYSCTFERCEHGPFGSRSAWSAHERLQHRRKWRCPFCEEDFSEAGDREIVKKHLLTEHSALDTRLVYDIIDAVSPRIEHLRLGECPFCDDRSLWDKLVDRNITKTGGESNVEFGTVSTDLYQRHLAYHLEQIALFAVPSAADEGLVVDENIESEQVQQDDDSEAEDDNNFDDDEIIHQTEESLEDNETQKASVAHHTFFQARGLRKCEGGHHGIT
jgi:hypothetical protein